LPDFEYPNDSPEYGLTGPAYAKARGLREKEQTTQDWHDQNAPMAQEWAVQRLRWVVEVAPLKRSQWVEEVRIPWSLVEEIREALRIYDGGRATAPASAPAEKAPD